MVMEVYINTCVSSFTSVYFGVVRSSQKVLAHFEFNLDTILSYCTGSIQTLLKCILLSLFFWCAVSIKIIKIKIYPLNCCSNFMYLSSRAIVHDNDADLPLSSNTKSV